MSNATNTRPAPWEDAFISNMKRRREELGLSQTEFARRLANEGLPFHQQTVQRTEIGARPVRLNEAVVISELLGQTLPEMMQADDAAAAWERIEAAALERSDLLSESVFPGIIKLKDQLSHALWTLHGEYERYLERFDGDPAAPRTEDERLSVTVALTQLQRARSALLTYMAWLGDELCIDVPATETDLAIDRTIGSVDGYA